MIKCLERNGEILYSGDLLFVCFALLRLSIRKPYVLHEKGNMVLRVAEEEEEKR